MWYTWTSSFVKHMPYRGFSCQCVLFGAALAFSALRDWMNSDSASVRAAYVSTQRWRDDRDHSKGCEIKLSCTLAPECPPLSWTLEANIPPSTLVLIITKDRMHKTWRTLRHRRARSPFSPHAEPWNNTWAPLACDSDDTHAVFLSFLSSLSSSSSSSMVLCSVEW